MFPLRPGNDEPAFEDDDVEPELDRDILDRLSAYAPEGGVDLGAEAEPSPAQSLVASRDGAGEDDHAAEQAARAEDERDEAEPAVFPVGSWERDRDEEEIREFALPETDLEEPSLFEAELSEFDVEAESELEPETAPSFTSGFDADRGTDDDDESDVVELPEGEGFEPVALEAGSGAETDVAEDELGEPGEISGVGEADGAEARPVESTLDESAEPEAVGRRSFRRRGAADPAKKSEKKKTEKKTKKERVPREKRGSRDRKSTRLVGLKIGASQIAAAQVVNNGAPELVEVFREPLEPGVVVSGEIRDSEALGAALKRLFELHKLPKRGIRLGISNNRIGVRIFEIEGVTDAQQLDNAIRFRAEEVLPIPLDQAVLDYVVLEDAVREDGTPWKRILLVVAYREVVDRYLQACRSAGLEVVGIDLEAFALLRAVEAPMDRGHHAGALVAVGIGHDRTTIAVSTGRYCEFTRVLDWGGWSLNVAIARELDRAPSEVEAIKRQLSFSTSTDVDGLTPEQAAKAREAIQRSLSGFVRELVASLQFYQGQPGALGIGEVVLTGGAAHMDGLPEALGELVGVPIRLGDPFKRVKVGPKVSHEGPRGSLAVAIGLGIED